MASPRGVARGEEPLHVDAAEESVRMPCPVRKYTRRLYRRQRLQTTNRGSDTNAQTARLRHGDSCASGHQLLTGRRSDGFLPRVARKEPLAERKTSSNCEQIGRSFHHDVIFPRQTLRMASSSLRFATAFKKESGSSF